MGVVDFRVPNKAASVGLGIDPCRRLEDQWKLELQTVFWGQKCKPAALASFSRAKHSNHR
jgi:hypothetical protein